MENEVIQAQRERPLWLRLIVGGNPSWTVVRIAIFLVAVVILMKWIILPIRVTGNSMEPTYWNGQVNIVNRLSYFKAQPQRGDVVAVEFAGKTLLLKRIVGLPGELVYIHSGRIFVNHEPLEEPYAKGKIPWKMKPEKLEPNQYLVIGDNRPVSDLHFKYNYQILGKVLF
ncbi:MAG: signal peptidase I [Verrucomicrobiales bacterium]